MNVPVDVLEPGGDVVKAAVIKDSILLIRHGHLFDFYKDAEIRLILVPRCKRAEVVVIETLFRDSFATFSKPVTGFRVIGTTEHMGFPSVVLPYHETSILEVMGKYSAAHLVSLLADAAEDLEVHHNHESVHGMVSPGKILITAKGKAFISGFICFSLFALLHPEYVHPRRDFKTEAPEILKAETLCRTKQADVFRFGMVIYQVLGGVITVPKRPGCSRELREHIAGRYVLKKTPLASSAVFELIKRATAFKPEDRPTISAIAASLRDISEG